jgi:transposase
LLARLQHRSLEVGAAPIVHLFIQRLDLPALFERHLAALPGPAPQLPTSTVLTLLISNILLSRQPLYGVRQWASGFVPELLGLRDDQVPFLDDDRLARALDHLFASDRATLLTRIVLQVIRVFTLVVEDLHQDTTPVLFSGKYRNQKPAPDEPSECEAATTASPAGSTPERPTVLEGATEEPPQPKRICRGYNKGHRRDLKQLLYDRTVTSDGAVAVLCKVHDGNTADTEVHQQNWIDLKTLFGPDFLYVADSKLCDADTLKYIDGNDGRFLTLMPGTWAEDKRFRQWVKDNEIGWKEVYRKANSRGKKKDAVVYRGFEDAKGSEEGFRILWYHSSLKDKSDKQTRQKRLRKICKRLERLRPPGKSEVFKSKEAAQKAVDRVLKDSKVSEWIEVSLVEKVEVKQKQVGKGRPSVKTEYVQEESKSYTIGVKVKQEEVRKVERGDGLFALMTNDKTLSLEEALRKYKYQPHLEKRHQQMKSVFAVRPVWLKKPKRVEALLWVYHVVDIIQALIEREVRKRMQEEKKESLPLYREGMRSKAPTCEQVLGAFEGIRQVRLLDGQGGEVRCLHDPLPDVAGTLLTMLHVDTAPYGIPCSE